MSRPRYGVNFHFEWRITLFTLVMVPLMVGLGFWQLQRGEEKERLAAAFDERRQRPPTPLSALWGSPVESLAYLPVRVTGTLLPDKYFLLDNQIRDGQVGFEVLNILRLTGNSDSVLVNRGWIAGDATRRSLPAVPVVAGEVDITGYVYVAPGAAYLLAEEPLEDAWPKTVQALEMDKLAPAVVAQLGGRVFPFTVRMDAGQPGALVADWQVVNMSPQKHQAYAVQWFAMATVLFIFFLMRSSNLWQRITDSGTTGK
ncbi:MAG: SURF1 family protein [Halioglobus sp.]